jgi:hypothetical protein
MRERRHDRSLACIPYRPRSKMKSATKRPTRTSRTSGGPLKRGRLGLGGGKSRPGTGTAAGKALYEEARQADREFAQTTKNAQRKQRH